MSARQIPEKQMIPGAHIKEESGSTYKIRGGTFNHEETRFTVGGALHDSGDGDRMRIKTYTDAAETTTEAADAETKAADTTKPDLSNVDPKMAEGPGAFETDESSEGVQVEEISGEELAKLQSEVAAKLEKTDYKSYAKELVEIVKSKDMEGLADHIDFPAFISCVKTNGGMVDTKEDFMKLDPVEIFSDEMEAAIGKVDVDTLEPVMAGIVLGDGVPNIILGITVDGELAITGMNY